MATLSKNRNGVEGSGEKPQGDGLRCGFFVAEGDVQFRQMNPSDLSEIMTIERASFSSPWSSRFFLQELGVPCARSLLAIIEGKTVGYIIYWLLPSEVDIHNLAVHPTYRRKGVGRSLLQSVINEARRHGSSRVTLEVRKSNEAAQLLYRSLGFVGQGVRKGYYSDDGEDALAMALEFER